MMRTRLTIDRAFLMSLLLVAAVAAPEAVALQKVPEQTHTVPCGVLERFEGVVQILDAGRTNVVDVSRKVPIACGGSVSVGKGWAQIKHRDGHRFYLASGSYIQMPFAESTSQDGDHVVLFRGEVYAQVEAGAGEFRVLTANARARSERGTMVVIYDREGEETQLVALERVASLENRFEASKRVQARAGEATSLNFKLLRVMPSDPRAVAVSTLKAKLAQFQIPEAEYNFAVRMAARRLNRKFAAPLVDEDRAPASVEAEGGKQVTGSEALSDEADGEAIAKEREAKKSAEKAQSYKRHEQAKKSADEEALQKKWQRHLSAGETDAQAAESLMHPGRAPAPKTRAPASVQENLNSGSAPAEEQEKRRLIEELSKIREED